MDVRCQKNRNISLTTTNREEAFCEVLGVQQKGLSTLLENKKNLKIDALKKVKENFILLMSHSSVPIQNPCVKSLFLS